MNADAHQSAQLQDETLAFDHHDVCGQPGEDTGGEHHVNDENDSDGLDVWFPDVFEMCSFW